MRADFGAVILSHGRPDRVSTYDSLRKFGYTGPITIVCDDMDDTLPDYQARYGDEVVVFDKKAAGEKFDVGNNFHEYDSVVFARNACFGIARELGYRYFIMLDDDYVRFQWRYDDEGRYFMASLAGRGGGGVKNLDGIFSLLADFLEESGAATVTMAQGGDFLGGAEGQYAGGICLTRKAMNTFVCDSERPFDFLGPINEDVNAYVYHATLGGLFFTLNQLSIVQRDTQSNASGLTDYYLRTGTYVKSFYTVMFHPAGATVQMMDGAKNPRLHHLINWNATTPMILSETLRKESEA